MVTAWMHRRTNERKYAEFQDREIVGEYSDEGHSGKNIKGRQEFMRMLNDIEDGIDSSKEAGKLLISIIAAVAEIDLRGIFEYIAFELQAPENASGQLDRLEACIMDLDHMPKRYRQYELEPWKSRGLRVAPVDNYLVLYIPDDDTQVVTIIRVMYGGRDVNMQLNIFTKTK